MEPSVKAEHYAKTRDEIARRMFSRLDLHEQRKWKKAAHDEHEAAMAAYEKGLHAEPSTESIDRQRYVLLIY